MAHYTGGNGENIRKWVEVRVAVYCRLTYPSSVLHHWLPGWRGFQSAGHRNPGRTTWLTEPTCTPALSAIIDLHLHPYSHYIRRALLIFTLRFGLIELSCVPYWLHTFCFFKSSKLSHTVLVWLSACLCFLLLWGDVAVGEVRLPGIISSRKPGAIRGKAAGFVTDSLSLSRSPPGVAADLVVSPRKTHFPQRWVRSLSLFN